MYVPNSNGDCTHFQDTQSPPVSEDEGNPPSVLSQEGDPPDDAFLMVTQHSWENDVLWDVPYTPGPPVTGAGMHKIIHTIPVFTKTSQVHLCL